MIKARLDIVAVRGASLDKHNSSTHRKNFIKCLLRLTSNKRPVQEDDILDFLLYHLAASVASNASPSTDHEKGGISMELGLAGRQHMRKVVIVVVSQNQLFGMCKSRKLV